jgi:hypothetical protein
LGVWVFSERQRSKATYTELSSPIRKKYKQTKPGSIASKGRIIEWWLGDEVVSGWGSRGHWIAGISWAAWLLFLCVHETGHGKLQ